MKRTPYAKNLASIGLTVVASWFLPRLVAAQQAASQTSAAATPAEDPGLVSVVLTYLDDGGWVMYVILAVSMVGTLLFVERGIDLWVMRRLNVKSFLADVTSKMEKGAWEQALRACNVRSKHPLVEVVRTAILSANQREKDVERAVEDVMLKGLDGVSKGIGMMALLANTATLLGLLGTIFGLITAFNSVAAASAAERQTALAAGISEAMYTTAFGISVAVPLLFFHHFLNRRQEVLVGDVESGATSVMVTLGKARAGNEQAPLRSGNGALHGDTAAAVL